MIMTNTEKLLTMKEIKEFSKTAVDPKFCITFLTRNLLTGYENKLDIEIFKEYENI